MEKETGPNRAKKIAVAKLCVRWAAKAIDFHLRKASSAAPAKSQRALQFADCFLFQRSRGKFDHLGFSLRFVIIGHL